MGRARKETERHRAAFELWYALGADRNLSELARRFHISSQAASQWSAAFRWQEKLAAREKLVSDLLSQKAIEGEVQAKEDALKICRAAIIRFAQTLQPVKDPITGAIIAPASAKIDATDFVQVVKLDQMLRGKASERSELLIGGSAFEKFVALLAGVIEREIADPELRARLSAGFEEAASGLGHA